MPSGDVVARGRQHRAGMCTIHIMTSAKLIRRMQKAGWVLRGTKGSHHVYVHPQRPGHVTVPHPRKDLGLGLVRAILKQAGLDK